MQLDNVDVFSFDGFMGQLFGVLPSDSNWCDLRTYVDPTGISGKCGLSSYNWRVFCFQFQGSLNSLFGFPDVAIPSLSPQYKWMQDQGAVGIITVAASDDDMFWQNPVLSNFEPAFSGADITIPIAIGFHSEFDNEITFPILFGFGFFTLSATDGIESLQPLLPNCFALTSLGYRIPYYLIGFPWSIGLFAASCIVLVRLLKRKEARFLVTLSLVLEGILSAPLRMLFLIGDAPRGYVPNSFKFEEWVFLVPNFLSISSSIMTIGVALKIVSRRIAKLPSRIYDSLFCALALAIFVVNYFYLTGWFKLYDSKEFSDIGTVVGGFGTNLRFGYYTNFIIASVFVILAFAAAYQIITAARATSGNSGKSRLMSKLACLLLLQALGTLMSSVSGFVESQTKPEGYSDGKPASAGVPGTPEYSVLAGYYNAMCGHRMPLYLVPLGFLLAASCQIAILASSSSSSSTSASTTNTNTKKKKKKNKR